MKKITFTVFILIILCALVTVSCSGSAPAEHTAQLPPGFDQLTVPGISLDGVVYIAQETPILTDRLISFPPVQRFSLGLAPAASSQSLWANAEFGSSAEAASAYRKVPEFNEIWKMNSNQNLLAVYPNDQSSAQLISAAQQNNFVSFKTAYVEQWNLLNNLPANPPGKAVGAGFIKISDNFKNWLSTIYTDKALLAELYDALGKVKIDTLGLGLYAQSDLNLINGWDFKDWGLSLLLVGDSAYPGFVLSVLANFLPSMGLQSATLNGETVYVKQQGDFYIMLKNAGGLVYAAVAPNSTECGNLLSSALGIFQ
jgi:hypothetical protein